MGRCGKLGVPIPVAERSTKWVCGRSVAGVAGSNPTGGMDKCLLCGLLGRVLCGELITRTEGPTVCGVCECDREASTLRPWPTRGRCPTG